MEKNVFFFKILNEMAFLQPTTSERDKKKRLKIFFTAILDRVWRFKGSKLGPGFQKLLKYN